MKILTTYPTDVFMGWKIALESLKDSSLHFEYLGKSVFDTFDQYQPDLFLVKEEELTDRLISLVGEFDDLTVILDKPTDKILNNENFVFDFNNPACDVVSFSNSKVKDKYKTVTSYLGPFNQENFDYLESTKSPYRIYGVDEKWDCPAYVGRITFEEIKHVYKSSERVLCNHTLEAMNVAFCGSIAVNFMGEEAKGFGREVLCENTYFDRAGDLMKLLGENSLSKKLVLAKEKYIV